MKKILIILACIFTLSISSVFADSTILNKNEISTNNISVSVTQNLGYVTSVSCSLKLEGNVKLSKFEWDSNIKYDYYKKYIYDETTKILNIYVIAPYKKNLVDKNKNIPLFSIEVIPNEDKSEYNLNLNNKNIILVNNNNDKVILTSTTNSAINFIAKKNVDVKPIVPSVPEIPSDNNNSQVTDNNSNENKEVETNYKKDKEQKEEIWDKKIVTIVIIAIGLIGIIAAIFIVLSSKKKI